MIVSDESLKPATYQRHDSLRKDRPNQEVNRVNKKNESKLEL